MDHDRGRVRRHVGIGEVWYAESDVPVGPWIYARKIASHEHYSFYNPKQDPMFDKEVAA